MSKSFQHFFLGGIACIVGFSFCQAQKGVVTGQVRGIDGVLEAATVSADHASVATNLLGIFSISLPAGSYELTVTHTGYKKITRRIIIDSARKIIVDFAMEPDETMGEVVILGSRSHERSNLSTPVPVDLISSGRLFQTRQTSLTQMVQFTIPSFNASRQLANEPVTLRGLEPDQLLILVNGKRYQNMAFMNFGGIRGILGRGAASNDLNSIPFSAIDKIEILRDGASAQYGSDAIAGVINIQMKKSWNQAWAQLHAGRFYQGDGESISFGINRGFAFLKKGFLSLSGSYRFQNPTFRGGEYAGTVYNPNKAVDDSIVLARNFDRNSVSNAGTSKHTAYAISMNGGYQLDERLELFWAAVISQRRTVFTSGYVFPKNANRINPELFPDGFQALPSNHANDLFAIAGIKGKTTRGWHWEYGSTLGRNTGKYFNKQTNNASQFSSLGSSAPTSFYTGSLAYAQLVNNVQLSKSFATTFGQPLNLALGGEWRYERYRIKAGEEASWQTYDTSGRKLGGSGGLVLSPRDAVNGKRNVAAVYADLESEFANRLLIDLAGRFEYYSDFGNNLAGKVSTRFKVTDKFFIRGSISNGFRAPGLQQSYYSQTRIAVSSSGGGYSIVTSGIFPNNSEVARALGIPSLEAERSINISGGFAVAAGRNLRLTIDGYWIQIKNRVILSNPFSRKSNQNIDSLLRDVTNVDQVQFFANGIHTRTKGVDVVLNGNWKIGESNLAVMFGINLTKTGLFGRIKTAGRLKNDSLNSNTLFNVEEKIKIEHGQPSDKAILTLTYHIGKTTLLVRNTRFGKTALAPAWIDPVTGVNSFLYESFSPKVLTDLSLTYSVKNWLSISVGANNMFNIYPDKLRDYRNTAEGTYIYSQEASPFGFNGGYYFMSTELKF